MLPDDVPAGVRLSTTAGWNQRRGDWERFLAASPDGCFVAENDADVVGTSATIVYGDALAWIGMVLVDPAERGRGIGTALLERAVRHLDERRVPSMKLDATPQGRPLYEGMGFETEYGIERWLLEREDEREDERSAERPEPRGADPEAAPGSIPEARAAASRATAAGAAAEVGPDLLALDREVFGADRSALLRSVAADAPDLVQVIRGPADLAGYALGRRGRIADHLGPWVAHDEDVAERLLDGFLARSRRGRIFVDRTLLCPWSGALLEARGFRFARPLTRMFRGSNASAGRPALQGGVLGPEFG
ncbi:MAG TPA: GNAT family N-acetyltransferase [Longimicrobiaceae bacterium]